MSEAYWNDLMTNSEFIIGSVERGAARKKLSTLGAKLPLDLVREIADFYLKRSAIDLWPAMRKAKDIHVPVFVQAFSGTSGMRGRLLVAAHEADGVEGFRRAGAWLAKIGQNSHVPGMLKSIKKNWVPLQLAQLVDPAVLTLCDDGLGEDTLALWGMGYIVVRGGAGHPKLNDVLARLEVAAGLDIYKVRERVIAAAESDAAAG